MDAIETEAVRRLHARSFSVGLDVKEGADESSFSSQADFSLHQRRSIPERVSKRPDGPPQHAFDFDLAVLNLTTCFFIARKRQNRMRQRVGADAHPALSQLPEFNNGQETPSSL